MLQSHFHLRNDTVRRPLLSLFRGTVSLPILFGVNLVTERFKSHVLVVDLSNNFESNNPRWES